MKPETFLEWKKEQRNIEELKKIKIRINWNVEKLLSIQEDNFDMEKDIALTEFGDPFPLEMTLEELFDIFMDTYGDNLNCPIDSLTIQGE